MKKFPFATVTYYDSGSSILAQYTKLPVLFTNKFKRYTTYGHPAAVFAAPTANYSINGLTSNGVHYTSLSNIASIEINPETILTFTTNYNLRTNTIAPGLFGGPAALYPVLGTAYQANPNWNGSIGNSDSINRQHIYANAIFAYQDNTITSARSFSLALFSTVYHPGYIYLASGVSASSTSVTLYGFKISEFADSFYGRYFGNYSPYMGADDRLRFTVPNGYKVAPPHFGGSSRCDAILIYDPSTLKMGWWYPFQGSASLSTNTITTAINNLANNISARIGPASYTNTPDLRVVSENGTILKTLVSSPGAPSTFLDTNTCWIGQNSFLPIGDDFYILAGYYYPAAVMGIKYYVSGSTWSPSSNSVVRPAVNFNPNMFTIGYYNANDYTDGAKIDLSETLIPPSGTYRTSISIEWLAE